MRRRGVAAIGAVLTLALAVAGCAKSDSDSGGGGGTVKLGLLTSLSGASSSVFKSTQLGVDARLQAYKDDKGKCSDKTFRVVTADDTSAPQGALAAAQKLVQQDKIDAMLDVSPNFFAAAPFMTTGAGKTIPVLGGAFDGAKEWQNANNNIFPALAAQDPGRAYTTLGAYFKSVGATKFASIGYNVPSSSASAEAQAKSAEAAGLKRVYFNVSVPTGSTDVGPLVLGIIKSGADAVAFSINPDTVFAVIAGLKQAKYPFKAIVSPTGYGADLLESAPAVQLAQGVTFTSSWTPNELQTPAALKLSKYLKGQGLKVDIPGFNQTMGWLVTDMYLHGLDLAGCDASKADYIKTLRKDKTWDAGGLYPSAFDFSTAKPAKQCQYFLKLKGKEFVPEPNAAPLCGPALS